MHTTKVLSVILFLFFYQQIGYSQVKSEKEFLQKIGIKDSVYSKTLKEYRELYIQFPANFNPETRYPVTYILDGEVLLPTVANVQSFYSGGFTPEMILVGISNNENRTRDLTTSKVKERYGMPFNERNGEAANFSKFIEEELIPFIEKKYPVTTYRGLIGHSYGGLFTIHTLIHHPALFSNFIAIDPSLDWDGQKLIKEAKEKIKENNYQEKTLFMSLSGQLHMQNPEITIDNVMNDTSDFTVFARSNITFSKMLKQQYQNKISFQWKFYPKDLHGTVLFPSIMDGMIANFKWYQMEKTSLINAPETPTSELKTLIDYRTEKLKRHFGYSIAPYPEDLLNALGYMSMDMQQFDKAKMYLNFAIKFYANSPNPYDSMADYYERKNENLEALKFVKKAFDISKSDYHKKRIGSLEEKIKKGK